MTELHISSLPIINMLQKACEVLVVDNHINLQFTYDLQTRKQMLTETQQANEMIDHLRELIKNNQADV